MGKYANGDSEATRLQGPARQRETAAKQQQAYPPQLRLLSRGQPSQTAALAIHTQWHHSLTPLRGLQSHRNELQPTYVNVGGHNSYFATAPPTTTRDHIIDTFRGTDGARWQSTLG